MHINFSSLKIHNFMSFGDAKLNFDDTGFVKVVGINENIDDLSMSNGSGKSALSESIIWCLTGDTLRGTKNVKNIYCDDGTYVDIEFYVDSNQYRLIRSKDSKDYKTALQIYINGKDCSGKGIRDSEKLLLDYLPDITTSLLGSVIILGQGLPQRFTQNSPSGRKEVLEKLSKSDFMISDLKDRVSKRKSELNDEIRSIDLALSELSGNKKILEQQIEECQKYLSEVDRDKLLNDLKYYSDQKLDLNAKKEELSKSIILDNETLSTLNVKINKINEDLDIELQKINNFYNTDIFKLTEERASKNGQIDALKKEIHRLENIKDICPTCGQKLPNVTKVDTSSMKESLNEFLSKVSTLSLNIDSLNSEKSAKISEIKDYFSKLKINDSNTHKAVSDHLKQCQYDISQIESDLSKNQDLTTKITAELATLDAKIDYNRQIILENNSKLLVINDKILYNNNDKDQKNSRLEIITKFDTALKRDFRGYLLSNIITYIEDRCKYYSKIIFDTDKIGFNLDGNDIDVSYCGKDYENLSGGEKQKVDIIIQFSIRDMLSNYLNFTSNILFLDEIFDNLDMIGCQKLLDLISSIDDIKNIYIITHRQDLSIPCDGEILIVKSNSGISEIR